MACDSTCTIPPAGIASPNRSTSSRASRVTQVTVGFTRITSSTAAPPSSGRSASSAHWSGCRRKRLQRQAELVAGGLHTGEGEEHQADDELAPGQRVVVLRGDERADEIVARVRTRSATTAST